MKIITRGEAMRIHRQHPATIPVCIIQDIPGVLAVFAERRKDSFGPYVRLMSG